MEIFITMNSLGLYPKITRPSRITPHSAALIDINIFSNDTVSGLLINDTSDHLPVFTEYNSSYKRNQSNDKIKYKQVRTKETMEAESCTSVCSRRAGEEGAGQSV